MSTENIINLISNFSKLDQDEKKKEIKKEIQSILEILNKIECLKNDSEDKLTQGFNDVENNEDNKFLMIYLLR